MFHDDPQVEDVTALLARAGQGRSPLGDDRRRPKVLEVHQVWGNLLVDTRHFVPDGPAVTVGPTLGHRWRLLGVDMGWVPEPLHLVLPYAPPMWSEVKSELKADFHGTCQRDLFVHEDGRWIAEVDGDRIPIEEDTRVVVEVDGLVYFAHLVHEARLVERRGASPDFPMMAIGSTTAFLGLMFALVVFFAPRPPESELIEIPEHLVTELSLPPPELDTEEPPGDPAPEGEKAKGEEGRAGKEDAPMKTARGKKVDVQKLELDRQVADNAGVMGFLNDDGALAGVFGTSSLSADLEGGIGGLIGAKGHQIGSGGLAGRGSGLGGGGEAEGIGGMGTHGIGDGDLAYGNGGGAKKRDGVLTTVDDSVIIGALDRAVIDEVIKNHMNQLKYCYQRELTKDGSLGGKITTKFTIARDGSVSATSIRSSTMANSAVEQCVQGTFMRMQFPAPRGGGIVIVSYPLMFTL